jgi:hypoxanthine phosphoribosyltransferase
MQGGNTIKLHDKIFEPYLSEEKILQAVDSMAQKINADYKGKCPLIIPVLNGAFMVAADLLKRINIDCEISFTKLSSYSGTSTTGTVKNLIGLGNDVEGRDIILLEDIVDTGITLEKLEVEVEKFKPKSVKVATLLLKPEAYHFRIPLGYVGLEIPNKFIVGYGLDYDGLGRNLKDIYVVTN